MPRIGVLVKSCDMSRDMLGQACALAAALLWAVALVLFKRSGEKIQPLALNLFRQSFTHYRFGIGAGVSAVLLVIILTFTLLFLVITGAFKMEES